MTNKIVLELPDKKEIIKETVDFIQLNGENNIVRLKIESEEKFNNLKGLTIYVFGNNNNIKLGKISCPYNETIGLTGLLINIGTPPDAAFDMKRDANNCNISIGDDVIICEANLFLQESDTSINIGNECMISWGIDIWCTDAHTITDLDGNPQNFSHSIEIGNHVWVGKDVKIGKNTKISDDSVVGWGSIVTRKFEQPNIIIAGNPAKMVKENINWNLRNLQNYQIYNKTR